MCDCECDKACKIDDYLHLKNCWCEKGIIDKLVLTCKDEILNTIETSFGNEIAICKNNCLIHTFLLVNICTFLLVLVSICCYYYYTKYQKNQKKILPCHHNSSKY